MVPTALALLAATLLVSCSDQAGPAAAPDAGTTPVGAGSQAQPAPAPAPPPRAAVDPNPMGLPPRKLKLDPGRRVFAVPEPMLAGMKPGSTVVLQAATVSAFDGEDLVIEGRAGPAYRVHAAYVIPVPDEPKLRHGDPVITEWNGVMRHAVVTKLGRDRTSVRYTDMDGKAPEAHLKTARFVRQVEGFAPGNYAALRAGAELRHVLLVSPIGEGAERKWLSLGFGGAAAVVDEASLVPIPIKLNPRPNAPVLVEWMGTMRAGTVQSSPETGLFTVKFERAGRPVTVGWGLIMKEPAAPK